MHFFKSTNWIEFEHAVWQQLRLKRKANFTSWCILIHFYKKALFICWMYNVHVSHKQFFRTHMNVPVLKKLSVFFMFSWSTSKTTCSQRPEWPGSLQWPVRTGWLAATDSPALSVYNPRTWLHVSQKYTYRDLPNDISNHQNVYIWMLFFFHLRHCES